MRVAICDDDVLQSNIIEEYIERIDDNSKKLSVDVFSKGEDILKMYDFHYNPYDIIFMDMEMTGINGIETAVQIRNKDSAVVVVFITSYNEYVYECFDAVPFRFLVKPVSYEIFENVFLAAVKKVKKEDKFLLISIRGADIRVNYNDILYFESQKRQVLICARDCEYLFYTKISELYQKLNPQDFIFTHKSYIVNMNFIKAILQDEVLLTNGAKVPLSKTMKKSVREKHLEFIKRGFNI